MSEATFQPKTTPARRRHGRNNGRSAAHKAYASENDAANIDLNDRTPRTPQKTGADSPAPANLQASQGGSKKQNRNKARSKQTPASPESARPGRHTPPNQSSSTKPSSAMAFAGATFHASPAPSALPLPSFFSKPSTESPSFKSSQEIRQQPSPPSDNDAAPTPSHPSSMSRVQESPLDFMFRAHREEKERQHRESFAGQRPAMPINASPSARSPYESRSLPKPATLPQAARASARLQTDGMGGAELDGTPGQPLGPAFSTPYHERIRAARTNSSRSVSTQNDSQHSFKSTSEDPTEALKKFLFSGSVPLGPGPTLEQPRTMQPAQGLNNNTVSAHNAYSSHEGRTNNLQAMEDDLRRILKLDLSSGPSTERRLFS